MLNLTVFDLQHRFCSLFFQGEVQALFLRHEGYLGAIGAFLKGAEEDSKEKTTNSNYFAQFVVNRATVCIDEY